MKAVFIIALCLLGFSAALSVPPAIPIRELTETFDKSGAYRVKEVGANGIEETELGTMKDLGDRGGPVSVKQGEFRYPSKDGEVHAKWTADERGFLISGNRIPTPPPIPAAIQKELQENKVKPPFGPGST